MAFKFYSSIVAQTVPTFVDRGNIQEWKCNNTAISGKVRLDQYTGSRGAVYVPTLGGTTVLPAGNIFTNKRNIVTSIDFQHVPYANTNAFNTCQGLTNLKSVTNITNKFAPGTTMRYFFYDCYNLNFKSTFTVPSNVTVVDSMFSECHSLNVKIVIPEGVTNMYRTFYRCNSFNQDIVIPRSVKNYSGCFEYCTALSSNIYIYNADATLAEYTFNGTSISKNVYIYYKYANGKNTRAYNFANSYNFTKGRNGVILHDMGTAPW